MQIAANDRAAAAADLSSAAARRHSHAISRNLPAPSHHANFSYATPTHTILSFLGNRGVQISYRLKFKKINMRS